MVLMLGSNAEMTKKGNDNNNNVATTKKGEKNNVWWNFIKWFCCLNLLLQTLNVFDDWRWTSLGVEAETSITYILSIFEHSIYISILTYV